MSPLKYSPHTAFPPIRSGDDDDFNDPVCAKVRTSTPLTYIRRFDPSYVPARCAQVFNANFVVPAAPVVELVGAYTDGGRPLPSVAYMPYDMMFGASLSTTLRQSEVLAGRTHASSVIPVDRCNDALSGTVTQAEEPLKDKA